MPQAPTSTQRLAAATFAYVSGAHPLWRALCLAIGLDDASPILREHVFAAADLTERNCDD